MTLLELRIKLRELRKTKQDIEADIEMIQLQIAQKEDEARFELADILDDRD